MIKKTLVFHFYAFEGFEENIAMKMHFELLKHYSNIFDKAIFCISVDDLENQELIRRVEMKLLDCGFKGEVDFIPVKNDIFGEVSTFKAQIFEKLDKIDGLVFFAHTKGVTNIKTFPDRTENFMKWITALYFYSLEFADEAEKKLIGLDFGLRRCFFGPLYTIDRNHTKGWYSGTFFWINPHRLYNDIKSGEITVPEIDDRDWVECLPSVYPYNDGYGRLCNHNNIAMYDGIVYLYNESDWEYISNFYGDGERYRQFYEEIKNKIEEHNEE